MSKLKELKNKIKKSKNQILLNDSKEDITAEEIKKEVENLKNLEKEFQQELKNKQNFINSFIKNDFKNFTLTTNGDYLIPQVDITGVQKLDNIQDLSQYVNNIKVKSFKGNFQTKVNGVITPLIKQGVATETVDIEKIDKSPFLLEEYSGFFKVPNTLDDDSKALEEFLNYYSNNKIIATKNSLILDLLNTATATDLNSPCNRQSITDHLVGMKVNSVIMTNTYGEKILNNSSSNVVEVNPRTIIIVDDSILPNEGATKEDIPFFLGDFKEIYLNELDQVGIFKSDIASFGKNFTNTRITSYLKSDVGNIGEIKKILCKKSTT